MKGQIVSLEELLGGGAQGYQFTERDERVDFYLEHMYPHLKLTGVNLPPVIGITGRANSGKSTAAKALQVALGYERVSFANPLKNVCAMIFRPLGAEHRHFFGSQADKNEPIPALGGVTGRHLLQIIGTEGFRGALADVWVRIGALDVESYSATGGRLVFDDVRFDNEAMMIRSRGGFVLELDVSGEEVPAPKHASEAGLSRDSIDATVSVTRGDVAGLQSGVIGKVLQLVYSRLRAAGAAHPAASAGLN